MDIHNPKKYYQTSNLIEETGASEHSIRRYVRILEENENYPEIERDNRQNRLFNELDRMTIVEMVRLVKEEKKGVQEASEAVVLRLNEFKILVEAQETPSEDIKMNEGTNGSYEQNERLEYAIELLEHLSKNQKELDERLKKIEAHQLMIENTVIPSEADNDSVEEASGDNEDEIIENNTGISNSPQEHKKTGVKGNLKL
ncbi:hypothetical protein ACFPFV_11490 [Salinicoccus siamensis]|uniref:HTH merR-type domain-containing protein n=1 Tax=Salinicoccus siamensis TaxID=381830 RepID=A0ABV5Z3G4_9STAP